MGKIFGISDLHVTIFTTPLEPTKAPAPAETNLFRLPRKILGENAMMKHDVLIPENVYAKKGFFSRLINGFRKTI